MIQIRDVFQLKFGRIDSGDHCVAVSVGSEREFPPPTSWFEVHVMVRAPQAGPTGPDPTLRS